MEEQQLLEAIRDIVQTEIAANNDALHDRVVSSVNVIVENKYDKILQLLTEDYGSVRGSADKGAALAEPFEQMQGRVADHEEALIQHNTRIEALEKNAG